MAELNIILHSEVQLMDWGESRASGPWIKLRLPDPELLEPFRGMDPAQMKKTQHVLHCTIADGDIAELVEEPPKGKHGHFWRDLIASGFFRAPEVCQAIGSPEDFEGWLRAQPSCISTRADYDDNNDIRNEPCHVLKVAEGSGKAIKPPYFAVPMTHEEHRRQHDQGYSAVTGLDEGEALEWMAKQASQYRNEWASMTLAEQLVPDCSSRAEVHPDTVRAWVSDNDLERFLPRSLR